MPKQISCIHCSCVFQTQKQLSDHTDSSSLCKKYRNILLVCQYCNYSCNGIKKIQEHQKVCSSTKLIPSDYENNLELKNEILELKLKIKIYSEIIKLNTSIKVDENNTSYGQLHNELSNLKQECVTGKPTKKEPTKKETTKKETTKKETKKEPTKKETKKEPTKKETTKDKLKKEPTKKETKKDKPKKEPTKKETKKEPISTELSKKIKLLETNISNLEGKEITHEDMKNIKDERNKLWKKLNFEQYADILNSNITQIIKLLHAKNINLLKYNIPPWDIRIIHSSENKHKDVIFQVLRSSISNFEDFKIDKVVFKTKLDVVLQTNKNTIEQNTYTVYKHPHIFKHFNTIGISTMTVEEILTTYFVNSSWKNNVVFKQSNSNKENIGFYTLDKIINHKKLWKQDIRCFYTMCDLSEYLIIELINKFKFIYKCLMNSNDFNSLSYEYIMSTDLKQLLINIMIVANQSKFSKILQNVIIQHASVSVVSENDIFPTEHDDSEKLTSILSETTEFKEKGRVKLIKQLFDSEISDDEISTIIEIA